MTFNPGKDELEGRIRALHTALTARDPNFDTALILGRVNLLYLTNSMQDGLFVLKKDGSAYYFVRRSFERAKQECPLDILYPMLSYRDIPGIISPDFGSTYIEADLIPVSMLERLKKYFSMTAVNPVDGIMMDLRAVKSQFEINLITYSGSLHRRLIDEVIPSLLREGMSEAEFQGEVFNAMMKLGYHGVSRFSLFQTEMVAGQFGFSENSVYPTNFDGPGGMKGMGAASPSAGSMERKLKTGDIVFADIGFGVGGYHSDKTQVYSFGRPPDGEILKIHRACIEVENRCAGRLAAGVKPSAIYEEIMSSLPAALSQGFMGFHQSVSFLGHGIGLHVSELPLIARGFDKPLAENMVIAIEPKCGIPGVGTVGVEDTYIVKDGYCECVTGGGKDIITV